MDKELVWYPSDKEGWSQGTLVNSIEEPIAKVKTSDGQVIELKRKFVMKMNEGTLKIVDDMITLDEINEPIILNNIKQRYLKDQIYTYIGPMLVSVNPFQVLSQYGEQLIPDYTRSSKESTRPHLYAIAQDAYKSLSMGMSQAVIISGESGAGKTEATKIILKFLTVAADPAGTGSSKELSRAILATNPILEAFGNAKTVRNNNSSRFGKFIRVMFDRGGAIIGANIDNYLLENTRIVHQAPDERNYHIFYQFVKGCSASQREKYRLLPSPDDFQYLSNGDVEAPGIDDVEWFQNTLNGFRQLQISDAEVDELFTILAGVLHIGNIEFTGDDKVGLKDMSQVKLVCEILKLSEKNMVTSLTQRMFGGGGRKSAYHIPLTFAQAVENRDAMAKEIYSKMFNYLVARLNKGLGAKNFDGNLFIGVLDIYGFEIFKHNSLEQFCINYANEKLHQQFNHYMFKAEQEEYAKEGVPWEKIEFVDNAACIDLIERTGVGILAMLDEEGQVPKGNDDSLVKKLATKHKPNSFFGYDQRKPDLFVVNHFAGSVEYTITGFLNKNKNTLTADVVRTMITSENVLVRKIFTDDITVDEKPEEEEEVASPFGARVGAKKPTLQRSKTLPVKSVDAANSSNASKISVTKKFKTELSALISTLAAAERHYVRCIKPNDTKRPREFENVKVLHQLRSNGVMETIRLRKAGYEQKILQDTFFYRYSVLGIGTPSEVRNFLDKFPGLWAIGNTKIFLKSQLIQDLEDERQKVLKESVIILQKFVRRHGAMFTLAKLIELERRRREEEERKRREEEERRRREEEERRRKEEEERLRKEEEERRKREEEERRRREEEERRQRQIEELRRQEEERIARIERELIEREERLKREEEERLILEAERVRQREKEEENRVAMARASALERIRMEREAEEKLFREAKERRERDLRLEEEEKLRKLKAAEAEAKATSALAEAKSTFEKKPKLTKSVTSVGNHAVEAQKSIDSGKLAGIRSMFGPTLKRATTISSNKNLNLEPELDEPISRFDEQSKAVSEARSLEENPTSPPPAAPSSNWNDREWNNPAADESESNESEQHWGQNVDPWAEMNNFSPDPVQVDDPPFSADPITPPLSRAAQLREEPTKKPSVVKGMLPPLKLGGLNLPPPAPSAPAPEIGYIASPRLEEFDTTLFSPRALEEVDPSSLPIETEVVELSFDPSLLPESKWGVLLTSPRFDRTLKDSDKAPAPLSPALLSGEISKAIEEDRANLDALRTAPQRVRFDTRAAMKMADDYEAELKSELMEAPSRERLDTRTALSLADKFAEELKPDPVATIRGSRVRMDTRTALRLADRYEAEIKEEVRRSRVIQRPSSVQDLPMPMNFARRPTAVEPQPLSVEVPPSSPEVAESGWLNQEAINNLDADSTLDLANSLAAELEQTLETEEPNEDSNFSSPLPLESSTDIYNQFGSYYEPAAIPPPEDVDFALPPPEVSQSLPPFDDSQSETFAVPESAPSFIFSAALVPTLEEQEPTFDPTPLDSPPSESLPPLPTEIQVPEGSFEAPQWESSDIFVPEQAPSFDFTAALSPPPVEEASFGNLEPIEEPTFPSIPPPPSNFDGPSDFEEPPPFDLPPPVDPVEDFQVPPAPPPLPESDNETFPVAEPVSSFDFGAAISEPSLPPPALLPPPQELSEATPLSDPLQGDDSIEDFGAPYSPDDDFESNEVPLPPSPFDLPTSVPISLPPSESLSSPSSPRDESEIDLKMGDIDSAPISAQSNDDMNADSPREAPQSQLDSFSPRHSGENANADLDNAFGELAVVPSSPSEPSSPVEPSSPTQPEVELDIGGIDSSPIAPDEVDAMNADSPREAPPSELDAVSPRDSEVKGPNDLDDAFGELSVLSPRSEPSSPSEVELDIGGIDSTPIAPDSVDAMNADSPREPPPSDLDAASPRDSEVKGANDLDDAFGELSVASPGSEATTPRSSLETSQTLELQINAIDSTPIAPDTMDDMNADSPRDPPPSDLDTVRDSAAEENSDLDDAFGDLSVRSPRPSEVHTETLPPPPLPPRIEEDSVDQSQREYAEFLGTPPSLPEVPPLPPPLPPQLPSLEPPVSSAIDEDWSEEGSHEPDATNPYDHNFPDFAVPQFNPLESETFSTPPAPFAPLSDSTEGDASLDQMMQNVGGEETSEMDIPTEQSLYADSSIDPDLLTRDNIDAIESENTIEEADEQTDFTSPDFDHSEFAIASYSPRHSMSPKVTPITSPRPVDSTVDGTEFDMYTGETESELEREFMEEFAPKPSVKSAPSQEVPTPYPPPLPESSPLEHVESTTELSQESVDLAPPEITSPALETLPSPWVPEDPQLNSEGPIEEAPITPALPLATEALEESLEPPISLPEPSLPTFNVEPAPELPEPVPEMAPSSFDFPALSPLPEPLRPSKAQEPIPDPFQSESETIEEVPFLPPPFEPQEPIPDPSFESQTFEEVPFVETEVPIPNHFESQSEEIPFLPPPIETQDPNPEDFEPQVIEEVPFTPPPIEPPQFGTEETSSFGEPSFIEEAPVVPPSDPQEAPLQSQAVDEAQGEEQPSEEPNTEGAALPEKKTLLVGVKKPAKRGTARAPTSNPIRALQERTSEPPKEDPTETEPAPVPKRPPAGAVSMGMPNFADLAAQKRAKQLEESGQTPLQDDSEGVSGTREVVEELKPEVPSASMAPMGYGMVLPGMNPGGLAALRAKLRSSQKAQGEKDVPTEPVPVESEAQGTSTSENSAPGAPEAPPKKKPIGGVSMFGGLGKVDMASLRGSLGRPNGRSSLKEPTSSSAEELPPPISAVPASETPEELPAPTKKPPVGGIPMFGLGRIDMGSARASLGRPGSGVKTVAEPPLVTADLPAPIPATSSKDLSFPEPVSSPLIENVPLEQPEPLPQSTSAQEFPPTDSFDSASNTEVSNDFGASPSDVNSSAFEVPPIDSAFDLPPPSLPEPTSVQESPFGDFSEPAFEQSPAMELPPSTLPPSDSAFDEPQHAKFEQSQSFPSAFEEVPPSEPISEPPQENPFEQGQSSSWTTVEETPAEVTPQPPALPPSEAHEDLPAHDAHPEDLVSPAHPEQAPSDSQFDLPSSTVDNEAPMAFDESEFGEQFTIPDHATPPGPSASVDDSTFEIPPPSQSISPPPPSVDPPIEAPMDVSDPSADQNEAHVDVPPPQEFRGSDEFGASNDFGQTEELPTPLPQSQSESYDFGTSEPEEVPPPPPAFEDPQTFDESSATQEWVPDNSWAEQPQEAPAHSEWGNDSTEPSTQEQWPQDQQSENSSQAQEHQEQSDWGQPQEQSQEEGGNQGQEQWDQSQQQDQQGWVEQSEPQQWNGDDNGQAEDWSQSPPQYQGDQSTYDFSEFDPQQSDPTPPPPPPQSPHPILASIQEEPQESEFDSTAFDIPTDDTDFSLPSFDSSTFEIPKFSEDMDMGSFDASQFDASRFDVADFEYDESQSEHQ